MAFYEKLSIYSNITIGKYGRCYYCGKKGYTNIDHFYPKSQFGKLKVRSCVECNHFKANLTPIEWLNWVNKRLAHCELLQESKQGCNYGSYIRSKCPGDCPTHKKFIFMQQSVLILIERVGWSFPKDTVRTYKRQKDE